MTTTTTSESSTVGVSVGATIGTAEGWARRAAIGTGFRAPSLYEIAYNNGPFAYPPVSNAPLLEEESEGWEVAVLGTLGKLDIELI